MMNPRKRPKRLREKQQKAARQAKLVAERITGPRKMTTHALNGLFKEFYENLIDKQSNRLFTATYDFFEESEDESET